MQIKSPFCWPGSVIPGLFAFRARAKGSGFRVYAFIIYNPLGFRGTDPIPVATLTVYLINDILQEPSDLEYPKPYRV